MEKNKDGFFKRTISWTLFVAYLFALVYFLFFAELMGRDHVQDSYSYNLTLFKEIKRFIIYYERLGFKAVMLNLVGNVVGFMPMGYLLPSISKRAKNWFLAVLLCFTFSMFVETIQLVWRVGSFDVDDLLLNTLGGLFGYLLYRFINRKKD